MKRHLQCKRVFIKFYCDNDIAFCYVIIHWWEKMHNTIINIQYGFRKQGKLRACDDGTEEGFQ